MASSTLGHALSYFKRGVELLRSRSVGGLTQAIRAATRSILSGRWTLALRGVAKRPSKAEKKLKRFNQIKEGHKRRADRARERRADKVSTLQTQRLEWLASLDDEARAEAERESAEAHAASRLAAADAKTAEKARLVEGLESGIRIAIDVSYNELMSTKEQKSLARQLCFAYATNRRLESPFALHICGLGGKTDAVLPDGFERWHVRKSEPEACAAFPIDELVYLTPDSPHTLDAIDHEHTYVIGGLVDGTIKKGTTLARAELWGVRTARLPMQEHASDYKPVLTINGVLDILASFRQTRDWATALGAVSATLARKCRGDGNKSPAPTGPPSPRMGGDDHRAAHESPLPREH